MVRVWSYIHGEDITQREFGFIDYPVRAGNLTPRELYYQVYFSDKCPVVHPYSISRWHNNGEYTESMRTADAFKHIFSV